MRQKLLIYGAGGLGREVLSLIRALPEWEAAGFVDDYAEKGKLLAGVPVIGGFESILENSYLVIAIGNPVHKALVVDKVKQKKVIFPSLIHPSAILQDKHSIQMGEGCIISAGSILTTDLQLGSHTLININVTIGHDCSIGDFCSVMPGVNIAGGVKIGNAVLIGSGANILNRMVIGEKSIIGMGAVVIANVDSDITVVGVPAKPISR
jgi:sugar O-acyltransferase (sialic acid O-acetyltransferase NeuD family)